MEKQVLPLDYPAGMPENFQQSYTNVMDRAAAMKAAGWKIEINKSLPYVAVDSPNEDEGYFFQGEDADNLLNETLTGIGEWVAAEDLILFFAAGW